MKLIVGLGNPGRKYAKTRHNLGFLVVEIIANSLPSQEFGRKNEWRIDKKFLSAVVRMPSAILVKPQTFVNNSGEAVKKIVKFYKIAPINILVIRDDIDLPEGKIRGPKSETGSGGHLGVESIITNLGTNSFYQLKIGVGRGRDSDPADFVLEKVDNKNWQYFEKLIKGEVVNRLKGWLNE